MTTTRSGTTLTATLTATLAAGLLLGGTALAGPTTDDARPAHGGTYGLDQRPCQSDMNDDGVVGFLELNSIIEQWGPCADRGDAALEPGAFEPAAGRCSADVNEDGSVGFVDLMMVLEQWGNCDMVLLP